MNFMGCQSLYTLKEIQIYAHLFSDQTFRKGLFDLPTNTPYFSFKYLRNMKNISSRNFTTKSLSS